jgi:uncharacterized heparinase superfamily protein
VTTPHRTVLATARYLGATADQLARRSGADTLAAGVSQKALFHRRGEITLYPDRLVLTGWYDDGDLVLRPSDIRSLDARYTELYGRFIGGLLNSGKPLIIHSNRTGEIYLLVNRREFLESTDDLTWLRRLRAWLAEHAGARG